MTQNEIFNFLNGLLSEYHYSFVDVDRCIKTYPEEIQDIESIFTVKRIEKIKLFIEIAELLSNDKDSIIAEFKLENPEVLDWNKESITEDDKLFLITCFIQKPAFFSMCWNWASFLEYKVYKKKQLKDSVDNQIIKVDFSLYEVQSWIIGDAEASLAAASEGLRETSYKKNISGLGILGYKYDSENMEMQFYLDIIESALDKKFKITISFEIENNFKEVILSSKGDGRKRVTSRIIEEIPNKGIQNIKVAFIQEK